MIHELKALSATVQRWITGMVVVLLLAWPIVRRLVQGSERPVPASQTSPSR